MQTINSKKELVNTVRHIFESFIRTCLMAVGLIAALPLLSSCMHDELDGCPVIDTRDDGEYSNLTLLLTVNGDLGSRTRAESDNPMGGEDGNGLRQGEHHENDVKNLCVFAFADPGGNQGVAGLPDNAPVKYCRYVDDVNFHPTYANSFYQDPISTEVDIRFEGKIVDGTDAFLVVANMGDLTSKKTLGEIRDYLVTKTLTRPAQGQPLANCTAFTMANANNSKNLGGDGTQNNPYRVAINLERTTARVDFMYDAVANSFDAPAGLPTNQNLLGYKVVDKYDNNIQTGWLFLSHIKLMNVAQYAPYALKRLAYKEGNDAESGLAYLADEEHVGDEAVKYVVEQNTWIKGKAGLTTYADLYGNTRIQYVASNYASAFGATEAVRNYATPQTYPNDKDGFNNGWSKDRISGEAYYVLDYINENTVEKEHTNGYNTTSLLLKTTFVPKDLKYKEGDVIKERAASYGESFIAMEVMSADKNRREKLYFADEDAVNLYKSQKSADIFAAPVLYNQGISYYTIWIRHDNNNNDALIGKMEYGIVRNNIYRIGVNKVLGPGSPIPVATENPEDVNLHIYVRKWNFMEVPTINL